MTNAELANKFKELGYTLLAGHVRSTITLWYCVTARPSKVYTLQVADETELINRLRLLPAALD